MKRRIVFRADASKRTGYGHFIRSLALASYLKNDFDCVFASFNEDSAYGVMTDYQLEQIIKTCEPAEVFGHNIDIFNNNFVEELRESDVAVLDNYYYDTEFQQKIKDKGCKLVCIDDMHQYHMICDLLLTASPLTREDFSLEPYTKFAGGIEWAFLREPFLSPIGTRNVPSQTKRIVIAMGGADAFNLTDKMIGIVEDVIPEAKIDVICGETVTVTKDNHPNVSIHRMVTAEEVTNLMDEADLGIFPASTVIIEALARSLPVIAGYYIDNQKELYNFGVSNGYFSGLGNLLDDTTNIEDRLGSIIGRPLPKPKSVDFKSQKDKIIDLFKSL